jgi:hypothetical protein
MTTRISGLMVALDHDIHEDDIQEVVSAVKMIKGVLNVTTHPSDMCEYVAKERIRTELGTKILEILYPNLQRDLQKGKGDQ